MRARKLSGAAPPPPIPDPQPIGPRGSRKRWYALVVLATGAVIAGVVFSALHENQQGTEKGPPAPLAVLSTSPFLNTHLSVGYVGDQKCLECHTEYKSYRDHPMARSLFHTAEAPPLEQFETAAELAFRSGPFRFQVIRKGGKQIHREWCEDAQGNVVAEQQVEMSYSIGSGAQTRSYLHSQGGCLFESPITWYVRKSQWDLSPGYVARGDHFTRQMTAQCLFCHAHEVRPIEHSINGYQEPPFGQLAIGCERCHGPGELHVGASRSPVPPVGVDRTIVNPRRLEPVLRDAICEQCHLQGEQIVWRRGRSPYEYRPGLPLHEYVQVFVEPPGSERPANIVGQAEQLRQSACYAKSAGAFKCTSCHDPHRSPPPAEAASFYQERCRTCHAARVPAPGGAAAPDCSVPATKRVAPDGRTDCVACHMPRNPAATQHLAVTDHRLLRRPDRPRQVPSASQSGNPPLVPFHQSHLAPDDPDPQRDLALAMVEYAGRMGEPRVRGSLMQRAGALLLPAVTRDSTDVPALEARALALLELGQFEPSLAAFEDVFDQAPDRERSLSGATDAARLLGRLDRAEVYARRLVEKYPHYPANHERLAQVLVERKAWPEALVAARAAVRGNPFRAEARELLIAALLENGDLAQARAEFDVLGVIDPPYQTKLRDRFRGRFTNSK
jgi:predicted CXXCH cytochrome family protein